MHTRHFTIFWSLPLEKVWFFPLYFFKDIRLINKHLKFNFIAIFVRIAMGAQRKNLFG